MKLSKFKLAVGYLFCSIFAITISAYAAQESNTSTYTISGAVTGLDQNKRITLTNNGTDSLVLTANGSFTFDKPVAANGSYDVTIGSPPAGQKCTVLNHSGTDVKFNISNVRVVCNVSNMHSFNGAQGASPIASLVQGNGGYLYGTTQAGGDNDGGVIFKINPVNSTFSVLFSFANPGGTSPKDALVLGKNGELYGTTQGGGANGNGTIFKINPADNKYSVLHHFDETGGGLPNGLVLGSDGDFYGTAHVHGEFGRGTIFKISPAGSYTVLHAFTEADGMLPLATLTAGSGGYFYGTTTRGGEYDKGTIFKIRPTETESIYEVIHSFSDMNKINPLGLVFGKDGNLYGVTTDGGDIGAGTVYKIDPSGSSYSVLHSFEGGPDDGSMPQGTLALGTDGFFYGTSLYGGNFGTGSLFKINPTDGTCIQLHSFKDQDGNTPASGVVLGKDGYFYGTTYSGGENNKGTIYRY